MGQIYAQWSSHLAIQLLVSCKNEYLQYSYRDITYNSFILKPHAVSFLLPVLGQGNLMENSFLRTSAQSIHH